MNDNLPATAAAANLPATYEAAQKALAECSRVDECKDWADKAAALASYARQAKDDTLLRHAQRIQLRAVNRCGELLKQIPSAQGANLTATGRDGSVPILSRQRAADDAGLSERQRKTALRVANVPRGEFETAVESEFPPSVNELAVRGTAHGAAAPAPVPADPATVAEATRLLRELARLCSTSDPAAVAFGRGIDADAMRAYVLAIDRWLDRFVTNLASGDEAA